VPDSTPSRFLRKQAARFITIQSRPVADNQPSMQDTGENPKKFAINSYQISRMQK
jgi:hypothetical protein